MQPHEIMSIQLKKWMELTADFTDVIANKPEKDIDKNDIIKIAQKVQDVINVINGKSKISGWRF